MVWRGRGWQAHWLWALPWLLGVAWLCIRQLDSYPPAVDEFYSMVNVGFASESPYTPGEVLASLQRNSANHTPLYFLLLNLWGRLVGAEVALARLLGVFCGLLSLAVVYRLARDFVAPLAGLLALVMMASNAFYNFYLPHARMYTLLALLAGVALWLYLRITQGRAQGHVGDYLALAAASYALANTHVFSGLLFAALGAYHLLHVRRDGRWLKVWLAFGAALLLFLPWAPVLLGPGIERSFVYLGAGRASLLEIMGSWFAVTFNGSWILALIALGGCLAVLRRRGLPRYHLIGLYFVLALALTAQLTDALDGAKMRFALAGWLPVIVLAAAGLHGLARRRIWLALAGLLWLAAGLAFQQAAEWQPYFNGRELSFKEPPWQVVSRMAQAEARPLMLSWYKFGEGHLVWGGHMDYAQSDYYFRERGVKFETFVPVERFRDYAGHHATSQPRHWVLIDSALVDAAAAAELDEIMSAAHYRACETVAIGQAGLLVKYSWQTLACRETQPTRYENELINYDFYGAALALDKDLLLFVDDWRPRGIVPSPQTKLSHQLLDSSGDNVAQLDLPLSNREGMRQFGIDVSGVAPGDYRLMAIVYDSGNGLRSGWLDGGEPSDMQVLGTVTIPEG